MEVLLHGDAARRPEGLTGDELALLRLYRACDGDARARVLRQARRLAHITKPAVPPRVATAQEDPTE